MKHARSIKDERELLIEQHKFLSSKRDSASKFESDGISYLKSSGPKTITGLGLGVRQSEINRIHEENLQNLSNLPEDEIMADREQLLSLLDPKIITFMLHKNRSSSTINDDTKLMPKSQQFAQEAKATSDPSVYPIPPDPQVPHMDSLEPEKLAWTVDLPPVAKTAPQLHSTRGSHPNRDSGDEKNKSTPPSQARFDLDGLVVPPKLILATHLGLHHHGDEPERAGYTIGELFHLARSSVPAQRRIALATISHALGQTRRGRHIPTLAPRRWPSLIHGLMDGPQVDDESDPMGERSNGGGRGGVAFLLRWCMDEAVAGLTGLSTTGIGGSGVGSSLSLVVECIRGMANLISDSYGEAWLSHCFDWAPGLIIPRRSTLAPPRNKRTVRHGKEDGAEGERDVDDAQLMSDDPVAFLFGPSQLAHRLAWLLVSDSSRDRLRNQLTGDAAGLWVPDLLLRAVHHSPSLAYRVFTVPNLYNVLISNFLTHCPPMEKQPPSTRPTHLSNVTGVPLPGVLRLCRVTMATSPSIRLSMVNDLQLVERCLSYLVPRPHFKEIDDITDYDDDDQQQLNRLIAHLPSVLPTNLSLSLQTEALRCLCTCLNYQDHGVSAVPHLALNLIWTNMLPLLTTFNNVYTCYKTLFNRSKESSEPLQPSIEKRQMISLLTPWLRFLTDASQTLVAVATTLPTTGSRRHQIDNWSAAKMDSWLTELTSLVLELLDHVSSQWTGESLDLIDLESRLQQHGVSSILTSVSAMSATRLIATYGDLNALTTKVTHNSKVSLWNEHLALLFQQPLWLRCLERFACKESVLTGCPENLHDVDIIPLPGLADVAGAPQGCEPEEPPATQPTMDWLHLSTNATASSNIRLESDLEPVSLAPACLPDLGCRVFFHFPTSLGQSDEIAAISWPSSSISVDSDDFGILSNETAGPSLPLMAALVQICEVIFTQWRLHLCVSGLSVSVLSPLIHWIQRLATVPSVFPWKSGVDALATDTRLPHTLIGVESELLGRAMQLIAKLTSQTGPLATELTNTLCRDAKRGNLLHRAALRLLPFLRGPLDAIANTIFSDIVFSSTHVTMSATQNGTQFNSLPVNDNLMSHLHRVESLYKSHVLGAQISSKSALSSINEEVEDSNLNPPISMGCSSMASITETLIPTNWIYLPILVWHERAVQRTLTTTMELTETERENCLGELTDILQWLLFLTHIRLPELKLDPITRLTHLCLASLAYPGAGGLGLGSAGLLMAKHVHAIGPMSRVRLSTGLEGLTGLPSACASFYDVYINLLGHFAAVSYNAPVFANLILWPCQQACHFKYRRALWGEYQNVLLAIRLRLDQLLIPMASFLEPEETEPSVLRLYASALLSGAVNLDRQPVLFLFAVHHLNRYLYNAQNAGSDLCQQFGHIARSVAGTTLPAGMTRRKMLDALRLYKQPIGFTEDQVTLLPDERLQCDNLSAPLVLGTREEVHEPTTSAIEYYSEDSLPSRRRDYWNKHFM